MPVLNRIASYAEEMKGWRRYLHQHPELAFDCHDTAILRDGFVDLGDRCGRDGEGGEIGENF